MGEFAHATELGHVVATAAEIKQNAEEVAEWGVTSGEESFTFHHRARTGSFSYLTDDFCVEELQHIILPMGLWRSAWDTLTLALVTYTAVTLPYVLGFLPAEEDVPALMQVIDFLIDMAFLSDIVVNFSM